MMSKTYSRKRTGVCNASLIGSSHGNYFCSVFDEKINVFSWTNVLFVESFKENTNYLWFRSTALVLGINKMFVNFSSEECCDNEQSLLSKSIQSNSNIESKTILV